MKKISFIIPILNEEKTIRECLDSILAIDYPQDKIEIVIAYGKSTDNTNKIIEEYESKHNNIITHPNPTGNTAWGRNICLMKATGEYVMNYSGHVTADKNLLKVLVSKLENAPDEVVSVGCSNISPVEQNVVGKVAGFIFGHIIGGKGLFVQNESYPDERFVDHVSFALYKKEIVDKVGRFDTHFWCGQDAELDLRLLENDYKIMYTPETKVSHYKRDTLKGLFKQMYKYGSARAKMGQKHKGTLKIQHYFGLLFLVGLVSSFFISINYIPLFLPAVLFFYTFGVFLLILFDTLSLYSFLAPVISFIIHTGYGLGFIGGFIYGKVIMR